MHDHTKGNYKVRLDRKNDRTGNNRHQSDGFIKIPGIEAVLAGESVDVENVDRKHNHKAESNDNTCHGKVGGKILQHRFFDHILCTHKNKNLLCKMTY